MDELDELKGLLRAEQIAPRPEAREAAISAALRAYDAKSSQLSQGSGWLARLRNAAHAASETLTGKRPMTSTHALAGGVSLAVLTLAVLTTASLQNLDGFARREAPLDAASAPAARDLTVEAKRQDETRERLMVPQVAPASADKAAGPALLRGAEEADMPAAPPPAAALQDRAGPAEMAVSSTAGSDLAGQRSGAIAPAPLAAVQSFAADEIAPPIYREQGRDRFREIETNPLKVTAEEPVSTFSIDVDTASYSFTRAALNDGVLPQADAVRVEELINYFPYRYAGPETREEPFRANMTVMPTPWNPATRLLHIGIKGYEVAKPDRPKANLVFLVDTSGSMEEPNKLPLLLNSLKLLVDGLGPDDTVSIVAYAGSAGAVLEPTKASDKAKIVAALENLWAGGSTAGAEGIRQAYQLARQNFDPAGVNRVILATDGDFNVGITDPEELKSFVERERQTGVFLSVLGFGRGNYNDELMQALAQNGNGAAAYIDTLNEARKVLVEEAASTMFPIAKDVKIQVEFNPATVSEYRLIGYETRLLAREDFNNDRVDAGEIGSGHTVTALYEITPVGSSAELVDGLRYEGTTRSDLGSASPAPPSSETGSPEYAFVKIRYKLPEADASRLIETPVPIAGDPAVAAVPAAEARFATAVAAFGQILRGGQYTGEFDYDDVIALAQASKGDDEFGYRAEFINLVRLARSAASLEPQRP